ncbi:hypothetical protein [Zophobihabitans entericus]|uniref:Uncharacterized protein n=1 Tax=Zophobihabitans entericus TaxID=1635327 RepID=A0A6G9IE98_9GAMM|nr:hypothetical protein [Zophobihabitans entericus]QIQ22142.1 hypothetical protein IPMB12_10875 [Zophobihabitans entericus]
MTQVFYVPGSTGFIDMVRHSETDDEPHGLYSGQPLSVKKQQYPNLIVDTEENVMNAIRAAARTSPKEISEEDYWNALECLPPVGFCGDRQSSSFKFLEGYTLDITYIYVKVLHENKYRYFEFLDVETLTHQEIMAIIHESNVLTVHN